MTPDDVEREFTLLTAAARYNELRLRDALAPPPDLPDPTDATDPPERAERAEREPARDAVPDAVALTRDEALLMLALGEALIRKAGYGRQLAVRTARAAGASWSQIGAALGTTKQSAWETHLRWIESHAPPPS
jgi:hypothetical protein